MGKLADDGLAEECAKLVSPVVEKALTGDKNYLQQFVSFAHGPAHDSKGAAEANGLSQAAVWEAEPEWLGESSEGVAETSMTGREPETI